MKRRTETIIDESGIELIVEYDFEKTDGYYEEPANVAAYVPASVLVELVLIELVIAGGGIDILPMINNKQKEKIKSLLTY